LVVGLIGHPLQLAASTVVAPNALANVEGDANNCIPLSGCAQVDRYQQVYASSQFGALAGPELITGIAFRPDSAQTSAFSFSFANVQIDLSTTSAAPDGLGPTYASNVGGDVTTVYSGALTLSSSNTGGGPKDFDVAISFQTPFSYDPTAGNLLLEWRNFSGETTSFVLDATSVDSDSVSRMYGFSAIETGGFARDTVGLVTQFTTTAVVPVPAALPLFGTAIAVLGFAARRKRKVA
jgi:hypothetical protein